MGIKPEKLKGAKNPANLKILVFRFILDSRLIFYNVGSMSVSRIPFSGEPKNQSFNQERAEAWWFSWSSVEDGCQVGF